MRRFHLIGIKGTGMCALALMLKSLGFYVQGSDYKQDFFTSMILKAHTVKVLKFNKRNIKEGFTFVASRAYDGTNPEIAEIKKRGQKLIYYNDFINEFFKGKKIGISGTHGKTTVCSILATILPKDETTYLIGDGQGFANLDSKYFVFEACEYRDHFLAYNYDYLLINNIELDHPDYFKNTEQLVSSFNNASKQAKTVIINGDCSLCKMITHDNILTFGLGEGNDIRGEVVHETAKGYLLKVSYKSKIELVYIPTLGEYMIYNFLAAFACLYALGFKRINHRKEIANFTMPHRRMNITKIKNNIIIDDYAHHPTEISSLLAATRLRYPNHKIICIFQPHTYSRTLTLLQDFIRSFTGVDELYLVKTFTSVREKKNKQYEKLILDCFTNAKRFTKKTIRYLRKKQNSVILFIGAGDIDRYIKYFRK